MKIDDLTSFFHAKPDGELIESICIFHLHTTDCASIDSLGPRYWKYRTGATASTSKFVQANSSNSNQLSDSNWPIIERPRDSGKCAWSIILSSGWWLQNLYKRSDSSRASAPNSAIPAALSIRHDRHQLWSIDQRRTSIVRSAKDSPVPGVSMVPIPFFLLPSTEFRAFLNMFQSDIQHFQLYTLVISFKSIPTVSYLVQCNCH